MASTSYQTDRRQQTVADASLILVTLIWGSTFVLVKDLIKEVPPLLFIATRFTLGAATLALVMLAMRRWRGLSRTELVWGGILGVALYAGYVFQTVGLQWTTASNAGFITGLSVVIVPLLGIPVLRQVPGVWAWLGVGFATVGLALLSLQVSDQGRLSISINTGDAFVLACAFAFAIHIVIVAKVARGLDPLRLAFVQILVCGLLSVLTSMLLETPVSGISAEVWAGTLFMGVVATALTIAIQVSMQRFTTAVHTVLIFSLEPVFAAIFGVWLHSDRLQAIGWTGAALILAGMLIAELGGHLVKRARAKGIIPT